MPLTEDNAQVYELGDINELPVAASVTVYEGAVVGDNGSGYARGLVAGDPFRGFAESQADNSSGAAADINIRVIEKGKIKLTITSVAITDVGKDVYASDDGTFTLTQGSNTRIGKVCRYVAANTAIVEFQANDGIEAELTDNSTGTASDTIAAITDAATKNAVASLAAKVNFLLRKMGQ